MDSTTTPSGARPQSIRPATSTHCVGRAAATPGQRPGGSWNGVANPCRVRVDGDGRPQPAERRHT
jgi:hypothetical protein